MQEYTRKAILAACNSNQAYFKFLTLRETELADESLPEISVSKQAYPILFDTPGIKGKNKDRKAKITWHDGSETEACFIYYGEGTRDEYKITNFGRNFPYLQPEYIGALFVLAKSESGDYLGFVLNTEEDIEEFVAALLICPTATEELIRVEDISKKIVPVLYGDK